MLTDPDIPMNSIAFYHRSDQRKGKMKPPPNPFTQVQNILRQTHTTTDFFTNTHRYRIFSQTHTSAKYFHKFTQVKNILTNTHNY